MWRWVVYLCVIALPIQASAERLALLVGVNQYPYATELTPLQGPENDVALIADSLTRFWGTATEPLQVTGPQATRANILSALDRFADRAGPNVQIIVYLAGHGTQLPSDHETDGLDEVFLPADFTTQQTDTTLSISNHIRDDEFALRFQRMTDAGAQVWLIADLCHAGTIDRSETGVQARFAVLQTRGQRALQDLNPPLNNPYAFSFRNARFASPRAGGSGRFIGFYAADADSQSIEMPVPAAVGEAPRVHGIFTFQLARALRTGSMRSFADLASTIERAFWDWGPGLPHPVFSGALSERLGPGVQTTRPIQASLGSNGPMINHGRLDGIEPGQVLALRRGPGEQPLAFLRVATAGLDSAQVLLVDDDPNLPDTLDTVIRAEGLDPVRWRDRWLRDRLPGLTVTATQNVQGPPMIVDLQSDDTNLARLVADAVQAVHPPGSVRMTGTSEPADLMLRQSDGALGFLRSESQSNGDTYELPLAGLTVDRLVAALSQIAKARHLLHLARDLATHTEVARLGMQITITPCANGSQVRRYTLTPGQNRPAIGHCDTVDVILENNGETALDVSVFYLDPAGQVYFLRGYPGSDLQGLRIAPGTQGTVSYIEDLPSGAVTGDMHLLVLAIPAHNPATAPVDFRWLEGDLPDPAATDAMMRSADTTSLPIARVWPLRTQAAP